MTDEEALDKARKIVLPFQLDILGPGPYVNVYAVTELEKAISAALKEAAGEKFTALDVEMFREGYGEHIADLVEAIKPFYECQMDTRKLSCHHWDKLWKAYKHALESEVYKPKKQDIPAPCTGGAS